MDKYRPATLFSWTKITDPPLSMKLNMINYLSDSQFWEILSFLSPKQYLYLKQYKLSPSIIEEKTQRISGHSYKIGFIYHHPFGEKIDFTIPIYTENHGESAKLLFLDIPNQYTWANMMGTTYAYSKDYIEKDQKEIAKALFEMSLQPKLDKDEWYSSFINDIFKILIEKNYLI
jgi:hypothetical protein